MNRVAKLFLILFAFSCNNEEDAINQIDEGEPAVTEIGIPIGDALTKEIGPDGGTISSGDGRWDITVPNGAVATKTLFSIQPITTFCPGGRYAYRLFPENLTFSKAVTLTFNYTDEELEGTSTDFLGIAYQGSDGIWYRLPTAVDNNAKTIVANATHFTDWSVLAQLEIAPANPPIPEIEAGTSFNLTLIGAEDNSPAPPPTPSSDPNEDELPSLPRAVPFRARWYVNGVENGNQNVGTITMTSPTNVDYHAPSTAPANNPVAISAKLTGFRAWDFVNGRRRTFNEVIVFKHIKIIDEYNYTLKIEDTALKYIVCAAIPTFTYIDSVKLDVKVKGMNVTISNVVNNPPIVDPMNFPSGYCTVTCNPGSIGSLNVTNGSGKRLDVRDPVDGYYRFDLLLHHVSMGQGGRMTLECPDIDPIHADASPLDDDSFFTFILVDEVQTFERPGYSITLTPKED